jgi:glycine/D-amino acid oxidase-like deaminating enzyme
MWGITLGLVTGHLLAEAIVSGTPPPELAPSARSADQARYPQWRTFSRVSQSTGR